MTGDKNQRNRITKKNRLKSTDESTIKENTSVSRPIFEQQRLKYLSEK